MKSIKILDHAVVMTTTITEEDYANITKFAPKSLTLVKKDRDIERTVFSVGFRKSGDGVLNEDVCIFESVNVDGNLSLIVVVDGEVSAKDVKNTIAETFYKEIKSISLIEAQVAEALVNVNAEIKAIDEIIEVETPVVSKKSK